MTHLNDSGIYKIVNIVNNKVYIGSATNFKKRWEVHKWYLINNKHPNRYLQFAWNKHSAWKFEFKIIEYYEKENLIEREQYWMDLYNPEYNLQPTAGSNLGFKYTEESKKKMSAWQIGRKMSDEAKEKMSKSASGNKRNLGCKHSKETKLKLSLALRGKMHTKEHKEKIKAGLLRNRQSIKEINLANHVSSLMSMGS